MFICSDILSQNLFEIYVAKSMKTTKVIQTDFAFLSKKILGNTKSLKYLISLLFGENISCS